MGDTHTVGLSVLTLYCTIIVKVHKDMCPMCSLMLVQNSFKVSESRLLAPKVEDKLESHCKHHNIILFCGY